MDSNGQIYIINDMVLQDSQGECETIGMRISDQLDDLVEQGKHIGKAGIRDPFHRVRSDLVPSIASSTFYHFLALQLVARGAGPQQGQGRSLI